MTTEACPKCSVSIDAGFRFCDQCGIELKICPICQTVGYKPRCLKDGNALIGRSSEGRSKSVDWSAPLSAPVAATTVLGPAGGRFIRLKHESGSISLVIDGPKTIGRREGEFKDKLGGYSQISRMHAKIFQDHSGQWLVEDLGSSNKTYVDDVEAGPGNPIPINPSSRVRFADVAFVVEAI